MDRSWFNDVGTKILLTILISIVNPGFVYVFQMWIFKCISNIRAAGATTMRDYILARMPMHFDIEKRFSLLLNLFFISIVLSTGIPLLLVIIPISIGILFFMEKYVFITFTKKPPIYTGIIMSFITKFIPVASLLSIGVSIFVLGNTELFPVSDSNDTLNSIIVSFLTKRN